MYISTFSNGCDVDYVGASPAPCDSWSRLTITYLLVGAVRYKKERSIASSEVHADRMRLRKYDVYEDELVEAEEELD
jgi:hypothetical protein